MGHDPTKVLFGVVTTSDRDISVHDGDPTTFVAGLAVRRATTGALQLTDDGTAALIGVSLGDDLSGTTKRTAVCRDGDGVPIRLKDNAVAATKTIGGLVFTAKVAGTGGNAITITIVDTGDVVPVVPTVVGNAVVINIDGGVTTANAIKAAVDAAPTAAAKVSVAVTSGQGAVAQNAASVQNLAGGTATDYDDFVVLGAVVKIDDTTGEASTDGDDTDAVYTSGVLTGVYADGTTAPAALIDMGGGF